MSASAADGRPSVGRRLLLAPVPLLLLLALVELVLALAGLGERGPALSRGFDPDAPYLVRDGDGWRTRFRTGDELVIPPRGRAPRVVLLGGSNVAWLPDWLLEGLLEERRGDQPAEVINLGREGYGSERVAILARQALALEPDVLVVASGHNEFIERGFAFELDEEYGGPGLRIAAQWLSALRSFRVLAAAVAPPAERGVEIDPAEQSLSRLSLAETLRYWEAYRDNLERLCARAVADDVRVVLCTLPSNPLVAPFVFAEETVLPPAAAEPHRALRHRGVRAIPEPLRAGIAPPERLHVTDWLDGDGQPGYRPPPVRRFAGPLGILGATEGPRFESVDGGHWPDPGGWTAAARQAVATQARLLARRLDAGQRRRLIGARAILADALQAVPDDPHAHFAMGLVEWLLGEDDAAAVQRLAVAASYDRAPRSANPTSNGIVRAVAAGRPGVTLLDADRLFVERCPDGLPGFDLFMDHCHLQPGARGALLADMADVLLELLP